MPSLMDLVEELRDMARNWRSLGIQLKVPQSTLLSIDFEIEDPVQALTETLMWSIHMRDLSWEDIVDALKSPGVGEMRLAERIEQKYCSENMTSSDSPKNAPISDIDITRIAWELKNWKKIAPFLGLTQSQEAEIERSGMNDYGKEKLAMLRKWQEIQGKGATYAALISAVTEAGNMDLAHYVQNVQETSDPDLTVEDIVPVATYLSPLMKEEVKTLGMLLGLSHSTIMNGYKCSSSIKYLDSIISAWFKKEDRVIQNGIPKWSVLVKALQHDLLKQNGIAEKIRVERLS